MRSLTIAVALTQLLILQSPAPVGFTSAAADAQAKAEKVFVDTVNPASARTWLAALTEEPHVAGTPAEKKLADYVLARFKEFGIEAELVRYDVFLNHPKHVSLKLIAPVEQELKLTEDPYDVDKDSTQDGMFPAFHGYGASGKAEGQVVYVNYGVPADFARLESMGISVEGKIVLARYGAAFRGLKVKEAQDRGAAGVLIYSDPRDDGYMAGEVYPDGPMRPESAIQRGSVLFLSHMPGDPSTPGWPSTSGAKRVAREQMENVPKIPSLPIAYAEAAKILRHLGGPVVPSEWQGGLPFAYHVGPGGARVSMDVQMDEGLKPIYNVIATIRGSSEPEKQVILGNHRDAWTHGAVDPNSGTAAQLAPTMSADEKLKTALRTYIRGFVEHVEATKILLSFWGRISSDKRARKANATLYATYRKGVAQMIEAGKASGELAPDVNVDGMAAVIVGIVIGVAMQSYFEKGAIDAEQAIEEAIQAALARLKPARR